MFKEIFKTKIDFDQLEKWRDKDRDNIPPVSFISVYRALGIADAALNYQKDHPEFEVTPLDNIACNTSTHRALKNFLEYIWSVYSLNLVDNNKVEWDTSKWPKDKKHYAKTVKGVVKASLAADFALYCPKIDDSFGINEIVLGFEVPDEEEETVV